RIGPFSACALRNPRPAQPMPEPVPRSHPHDQPPVCARLFVHWDVEDVFAQVGDVEDNMTKMTSWLGAVLALGLAAVPLSAGAQKNGAVNRAAPAAHAPAAHAPAARAFNPGARSFNRGPAFHPQARMSHPNFTARRFASPNFTRRS